MSAGLSSRSRDVKQCGLTSWSDLARGQRTAEARELAFRVTSPEGPGMGLALPATPSTPDNVEEASMMDIARVICKACDLTPNI
jgi:hypothetical protein